MILNLKCIFLILCFVNYTLQKHQNVKYSSRIAKISRSDVIEEASLNIQTDSLLYPFTDKENDESSDGDYQTTIQNNSPTIQKDLGFQLPFFGFNYNYTRVSLNGYLEFSDPESYETYPLVYPVKDWPKENDPSFIGIFHSKCRIGKLNSDDIDQRRPGVYFRVDKNLDTTNDAQAIDIRNRLTSDIHEGIIGAYNFIPKHAIIVTWKNVSFAGGIDSALYKTNTFQLVLATDEIYTYAMFNYLDIQWTSHTEAGGDVTTGEGGVPAFIGFNAGNGTRSFEYVPYSQNSLIRDVTVDGFGNGMPGRHYFRIDENIYLGSCNKELEGNNLELVFAPESGNMLGGTVVNITGPCFTPTDKVICRFDTTEVTGVVVSINRAFCIQPALEVDGVINLKITVNSDTVKYVGKYYVETPATATERIFFDDLSYNEVSPAEIKVTWDPSNLTLNQNAAIHISLWGYRDSNKVPEFLFIAELGTNIANTGLYIIIPSVYKNNDNNDLLDLQFGFIQLNVTENYIGNDNFTTRIWSRPIPLAWYFGPQWERNFGETWPKQFCNKWIMQEINMNGFMQNLPECPCTLEQALADKGKFMPDLECDKDSNPSCYLNKGAVHCVKSGLPSIDGSEQQCCYDKNHYLMLSNDQLWGSSPRRYHNLGDSSLIDNLTIPTLSQWYNDIAPKYFCCLWQDENSGGCEALREELRPTDSCVNYEAPGIAGIYGDPHIITFDDLEYTFNAQGEFVLVQSQDLKNRLDIQARFEPIPENLYGESKSTLLTSIVARGNTSTVVEVRLRPKEARWRYHLDVFVNSERVYFDQQSLKYKHYPGVMIYTPSYINNQSQVIVMFDSGAGLEVVENEGQMSAIVYLPQTFVNQTRGLFGNWSLDPTDDFVLPDDTNVAIPTGLNDFERVFHDFGLKWLLNSTTTPGIHSPLFLNEYGRDASYFNNLTFLPEFSMDVESLIPENRSEHRLIAYELCTSVNSECLYDYAMTYDKTFALTSLRAKNYITVLKDITQKKITSCGVLKTPRFGHKSTFLFVPGTKVTFECDEQFVLIGDDSRECMVDGQWNTPKYGFTKCF